MAVIDTVLVRALLATTTRQVVCGSNVFYSDGMPTLLYRAGDPVCGQ
jgi:hypothetical protein